MPYRHLFLLEIVKVYIQYNPNPDRKLVGDCVIRALCKILNQDWETAFLNLVITAFNMHDMPSSNSVWAEHLYQQGFHRHIIPDTCPACYTVRQFAQEHPHGTYLLGTGTHVIAVVSGDYFDTWDSGDESPIYYFKKED